jgi:hypothetical protein
MNKINSQKGSIAPIIAIIVVLVIIGIWYGTRSKDATVEPVVIASSTPITLLSPNGGETLKVGATTTISFKTEGDIKDNYRVVIWLEEGAAPLATIAATTTSHVITIPESILVGGDAVAPLAAGAYKIRVSLHDGEPCTGFCPPSEVKEIGSDTSDATFMIATSTIKK